MENSNLSTELNSKPYVKTFEVPTNRDLLQDGVDDESIFSRAARVSRKLTSQFGWPSLFLILIGPRSIYAPTPDTFKYFLLVGFLPISVGIALRMWARGYHRSQGFVLDGPYRHLRNPVEVGSLLVYLGAGFIAGLAPYYQIFHLLLAVLYLNWLALTYEGDITRRIGSPFFRYSKRVGRWFPSLLPGSNRTHRTYSVLHALSAEKESLIWAILYFGVLVLRHRYPEVSQWIAWP